MYTPLTITSHSTNAVIWKETSPTSPSSCRPLCLLLGKETDDSLKSYYHVLAAERDDLERNPIVIDVEGRSIRVNVKLPMTMIDGKMRTLMSGCGGAFCILCVCTREEARNLDESFSINRTGQQVADIWEKLESGQLKKKAGDQESRQGVTQCPIMDLEVLQSISPLHAGLRFFDFLLKIIYRLECSVFVWSEEQGVLGRCYQFLQAAKKKVRAAVKEGTGVAMDIPDSTGKGGTSTSGNVVHTLLSKQSNIDVLVSLVDEKYHSNLKECISRCYTITKLYNSDMLIDVEAYRQFCKDTKRKLLTDFNGNKTEWIYLTPTVHSILEHGADLIEANDGRGLLSYSESGLECNNKILRLIRISLSRKTSQADNLSDCLTRLAIRSDPEVRAAVPEGRVQTKCRQKSAVLRAQYPFESLSDYFIKGLILEG